MVDRNLPSIRDQRGVALVTALLVLLVVSLLAATLMVSISVDTKTSGHSMTEANALRMAEAGIGEAVARIRSGDVPDNNDPQMVAQIFLAAAGSIPVVTGDSVAMPTAQPAGNWLTYSTATKGPNVLTVEYKTDSLKTVIYRYDEDLNPPIQTVSGMPIFKISSTGRKGNGYRRIVTEVIQKPFNANVKSAVAAGVDIKFTGNAAVCGYNHRADTPVGTGEDGRAGAGGCNENPGLKQWETGSDDLPGFWSTGDVDVSGAAQATGTPAIQENQAGFYAGPWEVVGMSQAEFFSWIGPPSSNEPSPPNGIIHLDNNGTTQDQSGAFAYHGATGEGFLYVDGDLTLNAGFTYRGLIYVEGDLKLNGQAWILGALVVRGKAQLKNNGGASTLYSEDAIQQNLAKYGGNFVTLSWQELPY